MRQLLIGSLLFITPVVVMANPADPFAEHAWFRPFALPINPSSTFTHTIKPDQKGGYILSNNVTHDQQSCELVTQNVLSCDTDTDGLDPEIITYNPEKNTISFSSYFDSTELGVFYYDIASIPKPSPLSADWDSANKADCTSHQMPHRLTIPYNEYYNQYTEIGLNYHKEPNTNMQYAGPYIFSTLADGSYFIKPYTDMRGVTLGFKLLDKNNQPIKSLDNLDQLEHLHPVDVRGGELNLPVDCDFTRKQN